MSNAAGRSLEVDFFRGVVLLMIVVDHISGSMLGQFTLQRFAIFDAAEVFVFLAGYATAAAYTGIAARRGNSAARWRFLQRGWELYRAFLLTVALMLGLGLLFSALKLHTPTIEYTDISTFIDEPLLIAGEMIKLARQPYLSSILPMYMLFALAAPLIVPGVRRRPRLTVLLSVLVWSVAPYLGKFLPTVYPNNGWTFNPFAWQVIFVLGTVCRIHSFSAYHGEDADAVLRRRRLTRWAICSALAFVCVRLYFEYQPVSPAFKQNLSSLRIGSFMTMVWLAAMMVRRGWIARLAEKLPLVVIVGKHGLVCFVAGTMISLLADILLYLATHGDPARWAGLLADLSAIASMLLIGRMAQAWQEHRQRSRHAHPSMRTG
ncbi:OpgC domain-containing protein [Herbaspirillum lusitanum]|uniref:OpgC domain-containing protein n=1 Tax=Herbaspirillum lusitanum TaxID=213312 RepID=A0ABW9A467_9BURK